jgi:hypothetical protein
MNNMIKITLNLSEKEARRLADMCYHVSEEASDMPAINEEETFVGEPWFSEFWWESMGHFIRDEMRRGGVKEEFIIGMED